MSFSDELLRDTALTEESLLEDLEDLRAHYRAMGIQTRIVPATGELPLPSLVAAVDSEVEGEEDLLIITNSILPLDTESAEFTKFLQFYSELDVAVDQIDRTTLLEAVCRLNQTLPFGCCVVTREGKAGARGVQGFPIGDSIDQGVFTETAILFELSCDLIATVLDELQEGGSPDEAFAALAR